MLTASAALRLAWASGVIAALWLTVAWGLS